MSQGNEHYFWVKNTVLNGLISYAMVNELEVIDPKDKCLLVNETIGLPAYFARLLSDLYPEQNFAMERLNSRFSKLFGNAIRPGVTFEAVEFKKINGVARRTKVRILAPEKIRQFNLPPKEEFGQHLSQPKDSVNKKPKDKQLGISPPESAVYTLAQKCFSLSITDRLDLARGIVESIAQDYAEFKKVVQNGL